MITTLQQLHQTREEAYAIVRTRASISAGTSAVPAIGLDVAADVAILLELIPRLNNLFGLSKQQIADYSPEVQEMIAASRSAAGVSMVGVEVTKTLATYALKKIAGRAVVKQVLKFVPFLGWAANAAIGFRAMKYLGNAHVDDCYAIVEKMLDMQTAPIS